MSWSMLLIDGDQLRSAVVEAAFHDAGHQVAIIAKDAGSVRERIAKLRPDIIVDLEDSNRTSLDDVVSLSREVDWPIVARVEHARQREIDGPMAETLSIYAIVRLDEQDIRAVLKDTINQLQIHSGLTRELEEARGEVIGRKTIVRAIEILITAKGLTRDEASKRLVHAAIKQNRETFEVAQAVVRAVDQFNE